MVQYKIRSIKDFQILKIISRINLLLKQNQLVKKLKANRKVTLK